MPETITHKLHLSTIGDDSVSLAKQHGVGLEIADFCWAYHLDNGYEERLERIKADMRGIGSFWLHAPFAELSPCAIDPRARELAAFRYRQAIDTALKLGISDLVFHGGYIPQVYYPEYYVESAIDFYKAFLKTVDAPVNIALENVMEPSPDMLVEIVKGVGDARLGLCLDAGHANCNVSSLPPMGWIEPMSPYLKHIHIHNNLGDKDLHSPLGEGTVPMVEFIDTVLSLCPTASFTVENQHCASSVEWLAQKGYI
ncbi:MAG: sugar phosphate isomerase/epimerase [Clostridia bacterium]|nr:sugar phosphate isomerase/epimerase [Clostridia bacterium]